MISALNDIDLIHGDCSPWFPAEICAPFAYTTIEPSEEAGHINVSAAARPISERVDLRRARPKRNACSMNDVLTPAPARWYLAQAIAGGGNNGVSDSRHDVDFQSALQKSSL
jgi:hypothetical protein